MSDVLKQAIDMIDANNDDFDDIMAEYMAEGYVIITKDYFVLAKFDEANRELFVYITIGRLDEVMKLIYVDPLTISFLRKGVYKSYNYQKFLKKCRIK